MFRWTRYLMLVVAAVATFVMLSPDAEARRMGGGKSFGKSSGSLFSRSPAKPAQQGAASGKPGQAAAAGGRSGMMGMVGGLAAGLGLAWLASSLGFGEELANLMMIVLLVGGGLFLFKFLTRRMAAGSSGGAGMRPATAGGAAGGNNASYNRDASALQPSGSSFAGGASSSTAGSSAGSDPVDASLRVPADFDTEGFVRQAKVQFVRLQAVYDKGDLADLASFTTPEVFAELKLDLNERGDADNQTDVITIEGEMLGVDDQGSDYYASVHFTGMIREDPAAPAQPFSEIWTLSKPKSGSTGWVLAGIEQDSSAAAGQ